MKWTTSLLALTALGLGACGEEKAPKEETVTPDKVMTEATAPDMPEGADMAAISAALAHPDRPADDVEADSRRKPAETMAFMGLRPGMTVLEVEAGQGYFTELFAHAVGEEGQVYMQNPVSFEGFIGDALKTRFADGRLANVVQMRTNFDNLDAPDNSVDIVTWIQGPHELWFELDGQSLGDPEKSFTEIARVLKPGGVFVAVDHRAADGAGKEVGGMLHRIEESIIRGYAESAGLEFTRSADFLANPDDELTGSVFEPEIRGYTDQFVISLTKPKAE